MGTTMNKTGKLQIKFDDTTRMILRGLLDHKAKIVAEADAQIANYVRQAAIAHGISPDDWDTGDWDLNTDSGIVKRVIAPAPAPIPAPAPVSLFNKRKKR